jgi:hypothetical protein
MAPADERRNPCLIPLSYRLDTAIGSIGHPPSETQRLCCRDRRGTKSNALYTPRDAQPFAYEHGALPLFLQPEGIKAHDIVDAKVVVRIVTLDVVEPAVIDLLPGHREQGRVLFEDRLSLPDQVLALGLVEFAVNLGQECLEVKFFFSL